MMLPFGEEITADVEAEYEVVDGFVDPNAIDIDVDGIYIGRVGEVDRRYIPFLETCGPEAALRDSIGECVRSVWLPRVADRCTEQAIQNKRINQFCR
jgi:hypothetical protein